MQLHSGERMVTLGIIPMTCFVILLHIFFSQIQMKTSIEASKMPEDDATSYRLSLFQLGSTGQKHQNLLRVLGNAESQLSPSQIC